MGEDLTIVKSCALTEKQALQDKEQPAQKALEQPQNDLEAVQKKVDEKQANNKKQAMSQKQGPFSDERGYDAQDANTKFLVLINHIFHNLKNESQFKLLSSSKGDISKLDHSKYCIIHRSPNYTTDRCFKWKEYLEKLVKEGMCDKYLDKLVAQCIPGETNKKMQSHLP